MFKLALIPFIILVIVLVLLAPFGYIWAFNTLFPSFDIPYTFDTWLATLVVHSFFHVTISRNK